MTSKSIIKELKSRFLDGDKLTVKEIVEEYYDPRTPYSYLVAVKSTRQSLSGIKKSLRSKEGLWFGNLDPEGHYGIATTAEEVRYAVISYYKFVKGNLMSTQLLVGNAKANGILPDGLMQERMLVAKLEEEKDAR